MSVQTGCSRPKTLSVSCESVPEELRYDVDPWEQPRVMVFAGQFDTLKDRPAENYKTISIRAILDAVGNPASTTKVQAPATIGSSYCAHDARVHEVQARCGLYHLLRFDIDKGNHPLNDVCEAFSSIFSDSVFVVYSTSSAVPNDRRWRVLVPMVVPVCHDLRRAAELGVRESIEMLWGIDLDSSLDRAGQHIYLPAVAPEKRHADGSPIYYESQIIGKIPFAFAGSSIERTAHSILENEKQQEVLRRAAIAEQREKESQRRQAALERGDTTLSPIDWFNQNHTLEDVLVEAGYEQSPSNPADWRSPLQTSGSFATRIYDDYFVTLSASDAEAGLGTETRSGNRCGDAFSVLLHFMHGDDRNSAFRKIRALRDFANDEASAENLSDGGLPNIAPITLDELHRARLTPRVILPEKIYADVRMRIAAGGSSKTTLAIYEAVNLALGRPLWGQQPPTPVRTVFITREDSRELLVARIRIVMHNMMLDDRDVATVLDNIAVLDFTGISFRVSAVKDDVVVPHQRNLQQLLAVLRDWRPDWLICDPLVSFGVGESRVNDAEQGLIEAFRILRNELGCCVEGIHHTGKAVARDKTLDQYAGRGGSALSDGARMVVVMQPLAAKEWAKSTGSLLAEGETGLVMAFPKVSYCKPQPPIFIRRKGFAFRMEASVAPQDPDAALQGNADRVYAFLQHEYTEGRRYSMTKLEVVAEQMHLTRSVLREACNFLKTEGLVIYHGSRGRTGAHFEPLVIDRSGNAPI